MGKIAPEKIIAYTLLIVKLSCCIPPPRAASKLQLIFFKVSQALTFINHVGLAVPMFYASYRYSDNPSLMVPAVCLASVILCGLVQITVCRLNLERLQNIIADLESYCKRPEPYVKEMIRRYIDDYSPFYVTFALWMYFHIFIMIIQPYDYPFPVNHFVLKRIVLVHYTIVATQCGSQVCLNIFCALLFWSVAIKFDVLATEFQMSSDRTTMGKCIQEHKRLLRFAEEVTSVARFLVLAELIFGTVRLVFSALTLLTPISIFEKFQYTAVNLTALLSSFLSIWPADHLMYANSHVGNAVYNSPWYNQPLQIRNDLQIVLLRCQKPMRVSVGFLLPAASLAYYRAYVSTAASYFTVFRVTFEVNSPSS